jgi:hypothetical protein
MLTVTTPELLLLLLPPPVEQPVRAITDAAVIAIAEIIPVRLCMSSLSLMRG